MNILDVDNWSRSAVKEYLTRGTPLNTSIEKIAHDNGLNKDQIARVVEAANTDVYVNLFNQSKDKYINYETADTEKIAERIFGAPKVAEASMDDYLESPERLSDVNVHDEIPFEKSAEVVELPHTNMESTHEYYKIAALETKLQERMDEVEVEYQTNAGIFKSMMKQAVLGGTSFGNIEKALTTVYDNPIIHINLEESRIKLAQEIKLDATVSDMGTVNMENPLVKQAGLLLKHAEEYKTLKSKHAETHTKLIDHIKTSELMKKAVSTSTALKLTAAGAIGGGIATHTIAKKRQEQSNTANLMKSLPARYVR